MQRWMSAVVAIVCMLGVATNASATTLIRQSLEQLTATNSTITFGEILETRSYWNKGNTFILTDVRIRSLEALKDSRRVGAEFTITLMGGTVDDLTTLIVGGAELVKGKRYVLFLHEGDLPGAKGALTVRDHCQGVFDVVNDRGRGLRAVSQASRHALEPDFAGKSDAPGGVKGLTFNNLVESIRRHSDRAKQGAQ